MKEKQASQFFTDISTKIYLSCITYMGRQNCITQEIIVRIKKMERKSTFLYFHSLLHTKFQIPAIRQRHYKTKRKKII